MTEQVDHLTNIRLLLTRWYRDFNEPVPYKTELDRDVREMANKDFPLGVIEAGIRRYRDTYMYGRTRNWAHLMQSCMEVDRENKKIMPPGLAADVFFAEMSTGYIKAINTDARHFLARVEKLGFSPISANYIAAAHRIAGDGMRYMKDEFAMREFIKAYEFAIKDIKTPPIPAISSGTKSIKELIDGEVTTRIAQLHDPTLDSPTTKNSEG
jgi:hypothetical protein